VPGVTAALAAASALTLSLTHRRRAQRVQFVTGHDRHGELPDLDYEALADPRATTCIYMGRETAPALARRLLDHGVGEATPAMLVSNVSRRDQASVATTVGALAAGNLRFPEPGPMLVLVGHALDQDIAKTADLAEAAAR
jgi:uroporphyrin-III C-methyltransferase/precorrin-2 dehydrogenase/sirohydrochlorin ferrochelatase